MPQMVEYHGDPPRVDGDHGVAPGRRCGERVRIRCGTLAPARDRQVAEQFVEQVPESCGMAYGTPGARTARGAGSRGAYGLRVEAAGPRTFSIPCRTRTPLDLTTGRRVVSLADLGSSGSGREATHRRRCAACGHEQRGRTFP